MRELPRVDGWARHVDGHVGVLQRAGAQGFALGVKGVEPALGDGVVRLGRRGGGRYQGLAVVRGWTQQNVGNSCITKGCPYCPNLRTGFFGGDPALGNADFGIEILNGPSGSLGTLAIGMGNCTSGIPFLCGNLYVSLASPVTVIPMGKLAGNQCQATARLKVPIPVNSNTRTQRSRRRKVLYSSFACDRTTAGNQVAR